MPVAGDLDVEAAGLVAGRLADDVAGGVRRP